MFSTGKKQYAVCNGITRNELDRNYPTSKFLRVFNGVYVFVYKRGK